MHGPEVLVAAAADAQRHEAVAVVGLLLRPGVVVLLLVVLVLHPLPLERGAPRPLAEARAEASVLFDDICMRGHRIGIECD